MTKEIDFKNVDWNALNEAMIKVQDAWVEESKKLASSLGVSDACACDIMYLRSRSRHTQELEDKLIELHKNGTPPNMMEFGH